MKSRMVNWLKSHKKVGAIVATTVLALVLMGLMLPVHAAALAYEDVTGVYDVSSRLSPKYLDGARHPRAQLDTLTITTQVTKAITDATLTHMGTDIALTGLVGPGERPTIVLGGTDSDGTVTAIQGRVILDRDGNVSRIHGRIQTYVTSDGSRWDDSADGTSAVSVAAYYSEPHSCLLNGGTDANPKALLFWDPVSRLKLRHLTSLNTGQLGFWYNHQAAETNGPEMMLRFEPAGQARVPYYSGGTQGGVDITIMPFQGITGSGTWLECDLATTPTTTSIYYGNDPTDFTAFGGAPVVSLDLLEATIDAEAAMIAGGDDCGDWVLTLVSIELWEAGARTCYIDNVTIGGQLYTLEPNAYYTGFKATIQ